MNNLQEKIKEQLEKLKYLEGTRERNLQVLNNRVREINQEKAKAKKFVNNEN